ncbi:MAG: ABC transporter substrate-binding protein [Nitrososphaerota archaeon]
MKSKKTILLSVSTALVVILILSIIYVPSILSSRKTYDTVRLAVEFNNHAAPAYLAKHSNWFSEEGLNITIFNSYVTGVALANALARGDIDAAYICLGPALLSYSRGIDIVIVAGTHFNGYAIVSKEGISDPNQLEGKKVGVVEAGSNADLLFNLAVEKYGLDKKNIDVRRGNPPLLITLLLTNQVDAIVVPEHWATLAASNEGHHILLRSQDVWPDMQGSVLVVKRELLEKKPEVVEKLVKITMKGIEYIEKNKDEAANILIEEFSIASPMGVEPELVKGVSQTLSREIMSKSMDNLRYSIELDINSIQRYVELLYKLGYIDNLFDVGKITHKSFIG